MVRYYGRARQRTGAVNRNQLGLKMSGCPSRVGRNPMLGRYIGQRVNCMNGTCGPIMQHGVPIQQTNLRNQHPYCKDAVSKCLAAAGGVGHINTPYYRIPKSGERGCGVTGNCAGGLEQFVLTAASWQSDDGTGVWIGYQKGSDNNPHLSPHGSLDGIGSTFSVIKKTDIIYFAESAINGKCMDGAGGGEGKIDGICSIKLALNKSSRIVKWTKKYYDNSTKTFIKDLCLRINGKQYVANKIMDLEDQTATGIMFVLNPVSPSDNIHMEVGKLYKFGFY